ncbi:MAG: M20/M25/M40 family metallo-hydrolase [Candidatus Binatia bacterium]
MNHKVSLFSRLGLVLVLLVVWSSPSRSAGESGDFLRHVRYLASDDLMGRGVDGAGIDAARDYIAEEFEKTGLFPGGDGSYFQRLTVPVGITVQEASELNLNGSKAILLKDWVPLGFSASGNFEGAAVFVGYGITAKDYGYDDYQGIDVQGKIAVVLRYEPPPKDPKSPFGGAPRYSSHAALRSKAANARGHGAIGMILIDLDGSEKELISTRRSMGRSESGFFAVQVGRAAAEKWLGGKGISPRALKDGIDREGKPASMPLEGLQATLQVKLERAMKATDNVIGVLPGADARLKKEAVVIGAHYDHIGLGYYGTRDASSDGVIHNGADDNASGTAVLLDLAKKFAGQKRKPARTLVFIAFTAEELGLFGSRHYVDHPTVPIESTRAMINLDMVGRMRDRRVTVFGAATAKELEGWVRQTGDGLGLQTATPPGQVGRSDSASFYGKNVPVLHFFTGTHEDYHRPGDDWEKLNIEGMALVSEMVQRTVEKIAAGTEPLQFVKGPSNAAPVGTGQGYGAYLGTIPDFTETEKGVRISGVQAGSPAQTAGLKEGDVIIRLAEVDVASLEDLTFALRKKAAGDKVQIVVLRQGEPLTLEAVLGKRS